MITEEELRRLYLVEHKTMQQIAEILGCTRQNVHYLIHRNGIDVSKAERFMSTCTICGCEYEITRKRYVQSVRHFCSMECYKKYLHSPTFRLNRTGQRMGRIVMEKRLDRPLRSGEVVHHIDGNDLNNALDNLLLFSSHAEHMKHHHELRRDRAS